MRRKQGLAEEKNLLVPVGVELDKVKHPQKRSIKKHTLVYMGALQDNKGIQLIIEAMPEVLKKPMSHLF